jgi:hypothetical protein
MPAEAAATRSDVDDGLEILEDMDYQQRSWRHERVGWVVLAAILVSAVLGAFSHGILGYRSVSDDGRLTVAYEQVARRGGVTDLEVSVAPDALKSDRLQVHVSEHYLDRMDIEAITPEPAEMLADGDGVTFEFSIDDIDDRPASEIVLRFDLRPDQVGTADARIELVGQASVQFDQILLP